ncbi:Eco57I restriction-modification methylase domain-containing protein [Natrinema versiforme]|uniref:site-specific DNA-methyltransferase (adenine-specific) n=1 Tax=Natrinema versiforme TaxID=88724 RepID=A0A4P8WJW5_9EURY|nr:TaqI-like C-terminal specificity domain-containing protein [Natrinema versiforme]QCS43594.1 restriction endonuclease [Natrinema versiforme]
MQRSPAYRTTRELFATAALEDRLPETDAWNAVDTAELRESYAEIADHWERERGAGQNRSDPRSDAPFVRSVVETVGLPFDRRAANGCLDGHETPDSDAVAVADVSRWGHGDSRERDDREHGFGVPDYRLHAFLRDVSAPWAVVTNGRRWRLYRASGNCRLDSYYEIDLPGVLETGDLEAFKYFYCFFRREAFPDDAEGDCFLETVSNESNAVEREMAAALEANAREALAALAEGFLRHPDNDLDEADFDLLWDSSLVFLYRLLVVLSAEGRGWELLETADERDDRSGRGDAHPLERAIGAEADPTRSTDGCRNTLQSRLNDLFARVDEGRTGCTPSPGPEAERPIPAAPGWLFRPEPDGDDRREVRFLAANSIDDATLSKVIDLLTRQTESAGSSDDPSFIDYASLDLRHLGSCYERLLEYDLAVADAPLALEDGEYVRATDADAVAVEPGAVYLRADGGERKATGSYYTPEYVVEYIVEHTLEPLVDEVREAMLARHEPGTPGFADAFADRVLELTVLDPAMGCGHFLTQAADSLAREIVDAQATQAARAGPETVAAERGIQWARRRVARECLYGVDCDPLAVELARMSLWLRTRGADRPSDPLESHLQAGNALVGEDLESIDELAGASGSGPRVDGSPRNRLRHRDRLEAAANVRTAREFGLETVPDDACERLAAALGDDDAWERLARADWFETAQAQADAEGYVHWPLAFPEIFRDEDGTRRENPGFDAVVGNPPWVATAGRADISATIDADLRAYLAEAFETTEGQFDLAVALYELAVRQSRDGRVGFVVPDSLLAREQNEPIRAFVLDNAPPSRIVRVGTAFPGVETGAVICISGDGEDEVRCADAADRTTLASLSYNVIPQWVFEARDAKRFLIHLDDDARSILATVDRHPPLEAVATVSRGEEIGKRADRLASSEGPDTRPIAPGGAVRRYGLEEDEIRHISPEDVTKDEAIYRGPKLVFRQTSDSLVGTYDDTDLATIKSAYTIRAGSSDELKHLLGVLNSPLLNFYHHYTRAAYRSVFPQINQSTFESFPVAMDGGPDPTLVGAVDERLALTAERSRLSLDALETLGGYEDGASLGELGDCRRAAGADATKLAATTESWPNLQLGSVDVAANRSPVVLSATLRYKPDGGGLETDRWGYTETEPIPALEWPDLGAGRAALVETVVPAAVDRGRGVADFRASATKTISPLERLEGLTLPRLEDVADDLRAHLGDRARAEALDDRIAALDRRIADRVFDLYGLPDDERARVRHEFGEN